MNQRSTTIVSAAIRELLGDESPAVVQQPLHLGCSRDNGGEDIKGGTERYP